MNSEVLLSVRVRQVVAAVLVAIAVFGYALIALTIAVTEQHWLPDLKVYLAAGARMAEGASLYLPEQLAGPFHALCEGCFLYPPPFAQLLASTTAVPLWLAATIGFLLIIGAAWLSVWLATSVGGARRTLESAAWSFVAVAYFLPPINAAFNGNVGTVLGLLIVLVAMGGTVAGVSAALATLVKVSPGPLVLVALAAGRRSAVSVVVTLVAVTALSFVLSPGAWFDYPTVLLNMIGGEGDTSVNLALVEVASRSGLEGVALTVVSVGTLVAGVACVVGAIWAARRPGGLPLAVLLATVAMLVVPGTLWYHYLAVLAPLAAMAWPRAGHAARMVLVGAAIVTTVAWTPPLPSELALVSAATMLVVAGWTLWPRAVEAGVVSLSSVDDDA